METLDEIFQIRKENEMKIVVDINHPAHVHFFKYFIKEIEKKGHEVLVTVTKKDVNLNLLELYGIDYVFLGDYGNSIFSKFMNLPIIDVKLFNLVKDYQPDIFCGVGSIRIAHVAKLMGKPSINFYDTEISNKQRILFMPFVSHVFTPSSFLLDLGGKQIRYKGYHQLAFLHPRWFEPNVSVLDKLGLREGDPIITVRFVAWNATHDIGHHGIEDKADFIRELEKYGSVFISSEIPLPDSLAGYSFPLPPIFYHDLLYYSSLYVGDGGSTALEAATLGTPSILVDTSAKHCGITRELNQYGLLHYFDSQAEAYVKVRELLSDPNLNRRGRDGRSSLLRTHIDVTSFLIWVVEQYPDSIQILHEHPEIQNKFISSDHSLNSKLF